MTFWYRVWNWAMFVVPCLMLAVILRFASFRWRALMDWLPKLAVGQLELRDVMNLVLAAVGVRVGLVGIRLTREANKRAAEQDAVTAKQLEILGKLQELEGKQAAIAEKQDRLLQEQLSARCDLALEFFKTTQSHKWHVLIRNSGTKTANDCYWNLLFPAGWKDLVKVTANEGDTLRGPEPVDYKGESLLIVQGWLRRPVYTKQVVSCATLQVDPVLVENSAGLGPFCWRWDITSADGMFPADEYAQIVWDATHFTGQKSVDDSGPAH